MLSFLISGERKYVETLFIADPIVDVQCLVLVLLFSTVCPSSFAITLIEKRERAGCFTLNVFLMSCDSQCSVTLPHGAMG